MAHHSDDPNTANNFPSVHLIDGTDTQQSYAVVARRGTIFLGVKLYGLADGARFGLPETTYLHARLRSARVAKLAGLLDLTKDPDKVLDLSVHHLSLDDAWPNLSFEKVDAKRASLEIGLFIKGSLTMETATVVNRIEQGDLFQKISVFVVAQAGTENCIMEAGMLSDWLADRAKPMLVELKKKVAIEQMAEAAHKEFGIMIEHQMETVAPHMQQLSALYQKHMQVQTIVPPDGQNPSSK